MWVKLALSDETDADGSGQRRPLTEDLDNHKGHMAIKRLTLAHEAAAEFTTTPAAAGVLPCSQV